MKKILLPATIIIILILGFVSCTAKPTPAPPSNKPPDIPLIPSGPTTGQTGISYIYYTSSTDPENDNLFYWIDWGDGSPAVEWTGEYSSGEVVTVSHTFENQGSYNIKAKAKDVNDAESDWGSIDVIMPRDKITQSSLFQSLLERFPHAFPIIRYILKL